MNVRQVSLNISQINLEDCLPDLLQRLQKIIDKKTPILLLKAKVYDLCYSCLKEQGYNVIKKRLPFPGSGQQRIFRETFAKVIGAE